MLHAISTSKLAAMLITVSIGAAFVPAIAHGQIYVTNVGTNSINEYNLDGTPANVPLISGLNNPWSLAVSGSDIFVVNGANNNINGTIGEYTTTGATVNASLVSGLNNPNCIAVVGSDLFVMNGANGIIGEYTTSGAPVSASLVQVPPDPWSIVVCGTDCEPKQSGTLFV